MRTELAWIFSVLLVGCAAEIVTDSGVGRDATAPMDTGVEPVEDTGVDAGVPYDAAMCAPCGVWLMRCGGACVDPTTNPSNCGLCGVKCNATRQVCTGGACVNARTCRAGADSGCASGTTCCETATDVRICCPAGTRCERSEGFAGCCPTGQTCAPVPECRDL